MTNILSYTGYILDVIILLIIIISAMIGKLKGFFLAFYGAFNFIFSAACGYLLSGPLAKLLKATSVYRSLFENIRTKIHGIIAGSAQSGIESMADGSKNNLISLFEKFGRSGSEIQSEYARLVESGSENIADSLTDYIITPVCDTVLKVLSFVAVFFVAMLVFFLVMKGLDIVSKLPGLNAVNKTLGLIMGIITGVILAGIFTMVFSALIPYLISLDIGITEEAVGRSFIFRYASGAIPALFAAAYNAIGSKS